MVDMQPLLTCQLKIAAPSRFRYGFSTMKERRINSNTIRRINVTRVFHAIRREPGISPQYLSTVTGIDLATISIILTTLEQDGLIIRTLRPRTGRSGRPNSLVSINEASGVLAGVGIDVDKIQVVLCSYAGTNLAQAIVPGSLNVETVTASVVTTILSLLEQAGISRDMLTGVGVGIAGLVGLDGRLALAPAFNWHDIDFAERLSGPLGVPVHLENDIKAAATAESLFGSVTQQSDFIYLSGRSGIGGGFYLGGGLYRGPGGMAGEVGHMKLIPNGRPCRCGGHGCFETYVSEQAIFTTLREAGLPFTDLAAIHAAALSGNQDVLAILAQSGQYLGLGLANLANIFAPSSIILGGTLAGLADFLLPAARSMFATNTLKEIYRDISLTISTLGDKAVPMGGIAIALQHFIEEPPTGVVKLIAPQR